MLLFATMEFSEALLLRCVSVVITAVVPIEIKNADMLKSPGNG